MNDFDFIYECSRARAGLQQTYQALQEIRRGNQHNHRRLAKGCTKGQEREDLENMGKALMQLYIYNNKCIEELDKYLDSQ